MIVGILFGSVIFGFGAVAGWMIRELVVTRRHHATSAPTDNGFGFVATCTCGAQGWGKDRKSAARWMRKHLQGYGSVAGTVERYVSSAKDDR